MSLRCSADILRRPSQFLYRTSVMLEETLPLANVQALSLECVRTPLKTLKHGAVEAWGGGVHTCVPVTF